MKADASLIVVDASIAVKWFVTANEDGVPEADKLLAAHAAGEVQLVAPTLLVHELCNVFARRNREVPDLADAMGTFLDAGVTLLGPDREQVLLAAELVENGISAFDAAYVALAQVLGCRLETADRALAKRVALLTMKKIAAGPVLDSRPSRDILREIRETNDSRPI
ncbi:MAG: type II toxin-antitoxin system VapC family toxin [Coriobacteriia bacterium]|nr:type II toxin-antitoxin system VapC family toxin [Coriobacteriia bacterium]